MKGHIVRFALTALIVMGGMFTLSANGVTSVPEGDGSRFPKVIMERLDAEECRILAESGEILSMMELMDRVKMLTDGTMLDTSLIKQGDEYIYEMEVAGKDGVVRMLLVDARTGDMIKEK